MACHTSSTLMPNIKLQTPKDKKLQPGHEFAYKNHKLDLEVKILDQRSTTMVHDRCSWDELIYHYAKYQKPKGKDNNKK